MPSEQLPPNPYTTQPIKRLERLAGRDQELEKIRYYLQLTASAEDSYLIALIGERGVGKTSLLNAAQAKAQELGLLPVRIDLDEMTVRTAGHFWKEVYTALLEAVADARCWGGRGAIYQTLFLMLQAGSPAADPDFVVLKFPLVVAANSGHLDTITCSSTLLSRDFTDTLTELRRLNYKGFVLLVDEADLLGSNRPLIQSVRNIFQTLSGCALLVAGTEAVFPALTEVFSPIPRQFHKLEVRAFATQNQTRDLVTKPLRSPPYDEWKKLIPSNLVFEELHELCGGEPQELQLYCHHMYQQAEVRANAGKTYRMALEPQVFREVLKAYRDTTPLDTGAILARIEQLPDRLLHVSRWLRRRRLTREENVRCVLLEMGLKAGRLLNSEERSQAEVEVGLTYQDLFELGLLESADKFDLKGAPATYGFWKSFVAVEKNKRWSWEDDAADEAMKGLVLLQIARDTNANAFGWTSPEETNIFDSLAILRSTNVVEKTSQQSFIHFSHMTIEGRKRGIQQVIRTRLKVGHGGKTWLADLDYLEVEPQDAIHRRVEEWLDPRKELLATSGFQVELDGCFSCRLLSDEEYHRMAHVAGIHVWFEGEPFGKPLANQAIEKFMEGQGEEAVAIFRRVLSDREDSYFRNNLGYCLTCLGRFHEARDVFSQATTVKEKAIGPLWDYNSAVVAALCGNSAGAVAALEQLWTWIEKEGEQFAKTDRSYLCLMVLRCDLRGVDSRNDLALGAGTLLNLIALGRVNPAEARELLAKRYPEAHEPWVGSIVSPTRNLPESK